MDKVYIYGGMGRQSLKWVKYIFMEEWDARAYNG